MDNVVTVTLTVPSSGSPVLTKSCILYRKCVSFKGDENDLCTITICSNPNGFAVVFAFDQGHPARI